MSTRLATIEEVAQEIEVPVEILAEQAETEKFCWRCGLIEEETKGGKWVPVRLNYTGVCRDCEQELR